MVARRAQGSGGGPGVVVKQWREADVYAGSGPLWQGETEEDSLHGAMDVPTVGATPSSSVEKLRSGCVLALQIFRKTPEATPE